MKIQELRIGNYITVDNPQHWSELKNKPLQVMDIREAQGLDNEWTHSITISTNDIRYSGISQFIHFVKPIPITEELLLKCGFEKSQIDLRCAYVPHAYVGLRFENGDFRYYKESGKWSYRATRIDNPIFLHQLQNLYFVLTNKELEVQL